jgi:exodeoxyribonuclease X
MEKSYVLDTETTGVTDPQCIELAYCEVGLCNGLIGTISGLSQRYKPSKPIAYGAMATHHIQLADLEGCPPYTEARIPDGTTYLIGHNVDFDWKVLGCPDVRRIDTLCMARKLWPELDSHKLGAIAYFLFADTAREMLRNAHSAAADVDICCAVLSEMSLTIRPESMEALWQFSEAARIPEIITFGKHSGMAIADLPHDYKAWLMRQPDVDPYLMKAMRGETQ